MTALSPEARLLEIAREEVFRAVRIFGQTASEQFQLLTSGTVEIRVLDPIDFVSEDSDALAEATFGEKDRDLWQFNLSTELAREDAKEEKVRQIVRHELGHVQAGIDVGHGEAWVAATERLGGFAEAACPKGWLFE